MGQYSEILAFAMETARRAGDYVRSAKETEGLHIDAKSAIDFVSDKDTKSEEMIRRAVLERYPDHLFFGEESVYGESPEQEKEDLLRVRDEDYVWVIDPIDGTVNYIHDIPMYVISVAVVHHRQVVVGVVYDPSHNEMFSAELGGGTRLNGQPIHVTGAPTIDRMIINTSVPTCSMKERRRAMKLLPGASEQFQGYRIWNCAAYGLAAVAAGRIDASYESGVHLWDVAAGILLVREAGGTVTMIDGSPMVLTTNEILATNGNDHETISRVLTPEPGYWSN